MSHALRLRHCWLAACVAVAALGVRSTFAATRLAPFGGQFTGEAAPPAEPLVLWYRQPATLWTSALPVGKPTSNVLFWAVTTVNCPQETHGVRLAIGSNAASVWWVNGKEVIGIYGDRQTVIDDGVSKRRTLRKGPNVVRGAVINGGGATDFCARFLDREDGPLKGFTVSVGDVKQP
jgi:hypothetical protein